MQAAFALFLLQLERECYSCGENWMCAEIVLELKSFVLLLGCCGRWTSKKAWNDSFIVRWFGRYLIFCGTDENLRYFRWNLVKQCRQQQFILNFLHSINMIEGWYPKWSFHEGTLPLLCSKATQRAGESYVEFSSLLSKSMAARR